jgi:FKBP-type peptidyl-prolyl cis-trans isomerase SlyD
MQIARGSVVGLRYELLDSTGQLLERPEAPIEYLHGGYDGMFAEVEQALQGKTVGESCEVYLQPEEAFGDYDAELVHLEPRNKFPDGLEIGMRFEGEGEASGEVVFYTVTDIADDKVVVDGNHPLAGVAVRFRCTIDSVRAATAEEIAHGHPHTGKGHHH